jgi:hypothetical protein
LGPRAGQKVLSLRTVPGRDETATAGLCAEARGFSLHAGVRCGAHQRKELERHCPQCGGEFRIIAAIEEPAVIVRILTHLGLPARAPPRSPARPLALFQAA